MFRQLGKATDEVTIRLDGEDVRVPAGISVAAALLLLDRLPLRHTPVSGSGRAPFCLMGACFVCLVEIDGVPNQRACMQAVREGQQVRRQIDELKGPET